MKRFFLSTVAMAIAVVIAGCEPERVTGPTVVETVNDTVRDTVVRDTIRDTVHSGSLLKYTIRTRTTVYDTVKHGKTVRDTSKTVVQNSMIIGTVVARDDRTGVSMVVCSEVLSKCARTNSAGLYAITKNVVAARSMSNDTVKTPETVTVPQNDTTVKTISAEPPKIDTISDTVESVKTTVTGNDTLKIDSIATIDTIKVEISSDTVKVSITEVENDTIKDTLTFISNGVVLKEIPIVSWGHILPTNYIVQRNISVIDSTSDNSIKNVEAVYFMDSDSVAKVVTLGKSGRDFSGFIYTLYDDSSYRKDNKIYNIFIRGKDSENHILSKTDIEKFSERFGDIQTKILKSKVGVPQWMIPVITKVPNNTEVPEFVQTYKDTAEKTYWIGLDVIDSAKVFKIQKSNENTIGFRANGYFGSHDSIAVEIKTGSDSILIRHDNLDGFSPNPGPVQQYWIKGEHAGEFVEYKIGIYMNDYAEIQSLSKIEYRNIRFRVHTDK